MLGAAEDLAVAGGWAVVSGTATGGFLGRIGEAMRRLTNELGDAPTGRRVTGVSVAPGSRSRPSLRPRSRSIGGGGERCFCVCWRSGGTGLVTTVDEIHAADRVELSQLAADVQHLFARACRSG